MQRKLGYFVLSCLLLAGCSGTIPFTSQWRADPLVIDGDENDWTKGLFDMADEQVVIGVRNDAEYLYLCLIPQRQAAMPMLGRGLTIWFDSTGGKEKTFGINFPLGMGMMPVGPMMDRKDKPGEEGVEKRILESLKEFEIVGPGEYDRRRLAVEDSNDVTVRIKPGPQGLVYELRVPLVAGNGHEFGIGRLKRGAVGIGFETPERKRPTDGGGPRMGFGGGGEGRGGVRRGGMGGPGGGPPREVKPLDFWMKVKLADKAS